MLYEVSIFLVLLYGICAGTCLSSLVILAICKTFNLAFVEFDINIELEELDNSINSSLSWLFHLATSLVTGPVNCIKSTFSGVSFKPNPNYERVIAKKDKELARLRLAVIRQSACIELFGLQLAAALKPVAPPPDPRVARQAKDIRAKNAKISSLNKAASRQVGIQVQLRNDLAAQKTRVGGQGARLALVCSEKSRLEVQVRKLERERCKAYAKAKAEAATAKVREALEARTVAEEQRKEAQERLIGYEELLENTAFDFNDMQAKLAESRKINPRIYRQTVEQVHSLHSERDEARAAWEAAIKEKCTAKEAEFKANTRIEGLLEKVASAVDDKERTEKELNEAKSRRDNALKDAQDKAQLWETRYNAKVNDVANVRRALSERETELHEAATEAGVRSRSELVAAENEARTLEGDIQALRATNVSLGGEVQRLKKQARLARRAMQPTHEPVQGQETSGQSKAQGSVVNLQEELDKQKAELEADCRRILGEKDTENQRRVDAAVDEKNRMEQRLREEMVEYKNSLKDRANKLWNKKKGELDTRVQQANETVTNLRDDLKKLGEEKTAAIGAAQTDYEYLLLDVNRLNDKIKELKGGANDGTSEMDTVDARESSIDGDVAMNDTSHHVVMSFLPPTPDQPSVPFPVGGSTETVPATNPVPLGTSSGKKPANDLNSFDVAGNALANSPSLVRDHAGNPPAGQTFSFGATAGNQPAARPFSFSATAGNQPAGQPSVAGNQPAQNPFSLGALAGNLPAVDPLSSGDVSGNQPADNTHSLGTHAGNQPADESLSVDQFAGNQPAYDPLSSGDDAGNQPAYDPSAFGQYAGNQPAYDPSAFGQYAGNQPAYDPSAFGQYAGNQPAYDPSSFGQYAGNQPAYDPLSLGDDAGNQLAYDPSVFGQFGWNQIAYDSSLFGQFGGYQPVIDPSSYDNYAGYQPADGSLSFGHNAGNQPAYDPSSFGQFTGNQPVYDPPSFGNDAGYQPVIDPSLLGDMAGNQPANQVSSSGAPTQEASAYTSLPLVAATETSRAEEPLSLGSSAEGAQAHPSDLLSDHQPAPPLVDSTVRPLAPATSTLSPPLSRPSQSSSTAPTAKPPSVAERSSAPATAPKPTTKADEKASASASSTTTDADPAAVREAHRASELRDEVSRNKPNAQADKLREQLHGANQTLAKVLKLVTTQKRMLRVDTIHAVLCTNPILNENDFTNVEEREWPVLRRQLNEAQAVYDEMDTLLEDFERLRWQDLLDLLREPRLSDPVESEQPVQEAAPVAPAEGLVALPGLYVDGDAPVAPRVIRPMPRGRRGAQRRD